MPSVQIRGVPDVMHQRLRSKAALAGRSLNEYLLARLTDVASVPTVPELAERVRSRAAYTGPPAATVIREERDAR